MQFSLFIEYWAFACVTTRHRHAVSYSYMHRKLDIVVTKNE